LTLGRRLGLTATSYPHRTALVYEGRKYSYGELDELTGAFASGLRRLGVAKGDKVAILLPNCPEFVIAYFGAVKAGAAAVPLNTFLTAPEISYILHDSRAGCLVFSSIYKDRVAGLDGQSARPAHLICVGGEMPGTQGFESVIQGGRAEKDLPGDAVGDDEPAAVLYTSGTTGQPKGAVLTHRNLLSNAAACASMFRVTKNDRFLLFLPMFHAFSFLVCLLLPITLGGRVMILQSVKPFSKVIKAIVIGRASFFVAIPPVYKVLSHKKFPKLLLKLLPLRICVSGAAPLPIDVLTRFSANFPIPLLEGYGLTEASPVVSCNPLDGTRKPGSVGLPLPGVSVRIVSEDGSVLPPGQVGEITVRGKNVMTGYLNNEEATRDTLRDGWLYTGDLGYVDDEGYIFIVDRKKDLIITHGMNIYPREVEEALYAHPAVRQAAVIGIKDPSHGEIPKAYISLNDGSALTEKEVKGFLRERIAGYKIPRQVEFMDSLPMTPTGKILKKELKKMSITPPPRPLF
jgi:long-chain acyl-CoA synthetase